MVLGPCWAPTSSCPLALKHSWVCPSHEGHPEHPCSGRGPRLPSPTAARGLTPATNLAFGSLDRRGLIYCTLEDARGGSASRQPSSVFPGPLCSACDKEAGPVS